MNLFIEQRKVGLLRRSRWDVYMSQNYDGLKKIGVPMMTFQSSKEAFAYCNRQREENPLFRDAATWW